MWWWIGIGLLASGILLVVGGVSFGAGRLGKEYDESLERYFEDIRSGNRSTNHERP